VAMNNTGVSTSCQKNSNQMVMKGVHLISIEKNPELYSYASEESVRRSLDFARGLPPSKSSEEVPFHFYWRVPREFSRKQVLPLKSTIVTQTSRPRRIILWSNVDLSENPYVRPLLPFIETNGWLLDEEVHRTPLEGALALSGPTDDQMCWLGSDLFRLLCLYKYGGVYLDMDMVPLRDLGPILDFEFMYQWGSSGTTEKEPRLMINNAIIRLFKGSTLATELLTELARTSPVPNSNSWGRDLFSRVRERNPEWMVFPCAWFNTEWGFGKPLKPFRRPWFGTAKQELYEGAFTWHWHNQWDANVMKGSKFAILEDLMKRKFEDYLREHTNGRCR